MSTATPTAAVSGVTAGFGLREKLTVLVALALAVLGAVFIGVGFSAASDAHSQLALEQITGTPDMTPKAIAAEAKGAGLAGVALPTCSVAGKAIENGTSARCFASYMRIHTLEATHGLVYAKMGRYLDAKGQMTDDPAKAAVDPKTGQPVANHARDIWVTSTALRGALMQAYMADKLALFVEGMGAVLILVGAGLAIVGVRRRP